MNWLIEPEIFQDDSIDFISALDELKISYDIVKFGTPYERYIERFINRPDVIFHGSLQLGKMLREKTKVQVFCNLPEYECFFYYPRFGSYLLNSEYVMIPFGDLGRRKEWIFNTLGSSVFIRPSSGFKAFTGMVLDKRGLDRNLPFFMPKFEPQDLIVVAPINDIVREWRAVIVDEKLVAISQYKEQDEIIREVGAPDVVIDYVNQILEDVNYNPDVAWTLDVCEIKNEQLKVVETGSFSCAGFYAADSQAIIEAVNALDSKL